ncbi:MAG: flavodoxin [Bacteroides sp.]|nr:flavodoxin [Bacteroides sp.]
MRKILLVILSLFMLVMLTACSGSSDEPSAGGNTPISSSEPASGSDSAVSENNDSSEPVSNDSAIGSDNSANDTSSDANSDEQSEEIGKKVLVAYFSATGTTKALAEYAADAMKADIYEIVPAQPYTSADLNYNDKNSRSTKEMNDTNSRPEINGSVSDMSDYEIIFLGYPIWWGEAPRIIDTFMESYDFSGKTVVPFCTSSSSGMGSSAKNLHSLADSSVNWLDGARLKSNSSRGDMVSWINGLGLDVTAE